MESKGCELIAATRKSSIIESVCALVVCRRDSASAA